MVNRIVAAIVAFILQKVWGLLAKGVSTAYSSLKLWYDLKFKAPKQVEELIKTQETGSHEEQAQKTSDLLKP